MTSISNWSKNKDLATRIIKEQEIHLVSAYPVAPMNIAIELPDFDPSLYNNTTRPTFNCYERVAAKIWD